MENTRVVCPICKAFICEIELTLPKGTKIKSVCRVCKNKPEITI